MMIILYGLFLQIYCVSWFIFKCDNATQLTSYKQISEAFRHVFGTSIKYMHRVKSKERVVACCSLLCSLNGVKWQLYWSQIIIQRPPPPKQTGHSCQFLFSENALTLRPWWDSSFSSLLAHGVVMALFQVTLILIKILNKSAVKVSNKVLRRKKKRMCFVLYIHTYQFF